MALHVITAPMATIYCREHAAAFAVMRNTFVDKATTEPSITASTLPISWMYKSSPAVARAPLPPLHSPSPHISSMISFLTSLCLNRIKDFPDYYKCQITSAAPPPLGRHVLLITALSRASSSGLEVPLFINSSRNGAASLSNVMKWSRR